MFNNSKYSRWYFSIIMSAKEKHRNKTEGYYESHHIVPRSLGGTNQKTNLVLLSAKEHFIVHWLLTKMVDDKGHKHKMSCALFKMMHSAEGQPRYCSSALYEIAKRTMSKNSTGRKLSEETKARMSIARKGVPTKPPSEESRAKMASAKRGKRQSKQHIENMRNSKIGVPIRSYEFVDPQGNVHVVDNLRPFCQEHSLGYNTMVSLGNGTYVRDTYKGWTSAR